MLMLSMVAGRRSRLGGLAVLVTALGLSGGPMAPGTAAATPARATTTVQAFMTLYGYVDNSPPGRSIAHPCIHRRAGGAGTFTNPVTFATDVKEVGWCQIIYVPYMKRYFIHEDECSECDHDWRTLHKYRFDMWAGGDARRRSRTPRRPPCCAARTRGRAATASATPTIRSSPWTPRRTFP